MSMSAGAALVLGVVADASCSVQIFTSYADWSAASPGADQKLDFVFGGGVVVLAEQYTQFGVHFDLGTALASATSFTADGWGFISTFSSQGVVPVHFDLLQHAFAVDFINATQLSFFLGDALVYQSTPFFTLSPPKFRGFVLDDAFDRVVITTGGLGGDVRMDNLYVGTPIPAPAVSSLVALGFTAARRRRR